MATLTQIQSFLAPKKMIIAGASRNPKKFGGQVFSELLKKGFSLYPLHPEAEQIQGITCYKSLDDIPEMPEYLYIVTPKKETYDIVEQAVNHGIRNIWIQQQSDTKEAVELARRHNAELITGHCMFMYAEPVGNIHGFHRFLSRLFGAYPKA